MNCPLLLVLELDSSTSSLRLRTSRGVDAAPWPGPGEVENERARVGASEGEVLPFSHPEFRRSTHDQTPRRCPECMHDYFHCNQFSPCCNAGKKWVRLPFVPHVESPYSDDSLRLRLRACMGDNLPHFGKPVSLWVECDSVCMSLCSCSFMVLKKVNLGVLDCWSLEGAGVQVQLESDVPCHGMA